jgi:hypothetical protein
LALATKLSVCSVVEHVVSLGAYRLNVTVSPAARSLVPSRSALSWSVVPREPFFGIAVLVIVGDAWAMLTGSAPQAVAVAALLLSPLKLATHSYVPAVSATKPVFV